MTDPALCHSDRVEETQAEIVRLNTIITALMDRAERGTNLEVSGFGVFQTAVILEEQVRRRTEELEAALRRNETTNAALREA